MMQKFTYCCMSVSGVVTLNSVISTGRILYLFSDNQKPCGWFYLPTFTERLAWVILRVPWIHNMQKANNACGWWAANSHRPVIVCQAVQPPCHSFKAFCVFNVFYKTLAGNNLWGIISLKLYKFTITLVLVWFLQDCTSDSSAAMTWVFLTCRKGFTYL